MTFWDIVKLIFFAPIAFILGVFVTALIAAAIDAIIENLS